MSTQWGEGAEEKNVFIYLSTEKSFTHHRVRGQKLNCTLTFYEFYHGVI